MKKHVKIAIFLSLLITVIAGCSSSNQKASEKKYRVATDPVWPPFEMVDEKTKEITGFDIDLMNAIAENQGFAVEYVNVNFDALIPGVGTCQYDAGASAITITDERKKQMLFSDPYVNIGQVMVVREDVNDLVNKEDFAGKVIGAQTGTTGAIMAEEWQTEGLVTFRGYDTIDLAYMDLKNGQIDGVLGDNTMAEAYVKSMGGLKIVGDQYSSEELAFAVCKDNKDLLDKINAGLKALKESGKFDEIYKKYFEQSVNK
ncbi:MAG TPA: basic amino acid ABC transporter substrate-binding protein [Flexilinea sp.]|jgi:polar amino acid transport system substrate-binding protein|nr:basic amino acid ABC transporter substrate-binding protein [Flexilinea sp.]HOG22488.1 basic amino acid ABC transporter substrate-binding protein [Flexilinea sp.]HOG60896.1 basic amino acid ABC transporter substrate-binding protein [Flexilinea sp.]HOP02354.1 basic amino acid ABC transporter substrate-binding protein [Flexilinea sp.]HOR55485.1 basic amino acid ABC transporter substrate-binding protein [Flexilinea sp.]